MSDSYPQPPARSVADLIAELPPVVKIAAFDFKLEKWDSLAATAGNRWGECSFIEQTIRVRRDMPTRFKLADTLLHELGHAIYWTYGIDDADKEERIVGTTSTAMAALYRDNPWLLWWLQKALAL